MCIVYFIKKNKRKKQENKDLENNEKIAETNFTEPIKNEHTEENNKTSEAISIVNNDEPQNRRQRLKRIETMDLTNVKVKIFLVLKSSCLF